MKVKNYRFNKEIKNINELKEYIGMPIYFYYKMIVHSSKDAQIYSAWISTVEKIEKGYMLDNPNTITDKRIWGYNILLVMCGFEKKIHFLYNDDYKEMRFCNAQTNARTLTEEEFEMYRKKTMKRRILCQS